MLSTYSFFKHKCDTWSSLSLSQQFITDYIITIQSGSLSVHKQTDSVNRLHGTSTANKDVGLLSCHVSIKNGRKHQWQHNAFWKCGQVNLWNLRHNCISIRIWIHIPGVNSQYIRPPSSLATLVIWPNSTLSCTQYSLRQVHVCVK